MSANPKGCFLSVEQLADRLGVSRSTAYLLVRDGQVPAIRFRGSIKVPVGAFEAWLAARDKEALAAVQETVAL